MSIQEKIDEPRNPKNDGSYLNSQEEVSRPKYFREKRAVWMYGLSRTKLYQLAKSGDIKSISLQKEGTSRGTRLFCAESIERYIESFAK